MTGIVRCGTLIGLLAISVACTDDPPTAPSSLPTSTAPVQPRPTVNVPPLTGPSYTYHFLSGRFSRSVMPYTATSQYVLYENGAFHYTSSAGELTGVYGGDGNVVTLRFASSSLWQATATINGYKLEVQYNDVMHGADFEDADYKF